MLFSIVFCFFLPIMLYVLPIHKMIDFRLAQVSTLAKLALILGKD